MRRAFAIVLIGLFSLSLISPALAASSADSKLPACCRRDGNHHCVMGNGLSNASQGPGLQARCPSFPSRLAVCVNETVSLAGGALVMVASPIMQPVSSPQAESLYRSSYDRAGQKRGPPTSLA